ncbi:MAG: GvpL/GvpF family gas vesicle protein [Chlorobiales bacterium]|nr:GvpL/GvpF family gas vesicle protein [Chlorobiales bacterium]
MSEEGKYIYCIVASSQERNFGPIGVGERGDEVMTISYENLSMVVSNHPLTRIMLEPKTIIAHEKIIEKIMREYNSVLPVKFGTVARNADEIRDLLDRRYREFMSLLNYFENKIELNVKCVWENLNDVLLKIGKEHQKIKMLKKEIQQNDFESDTEKMVALGKIVEGELIRKREDVSDVILSVLKKIAVDYKANDLSDEKMLFNAAFLIDSGREKEFDNIVDDLSEEYKNVVSFIYSGPFPPYNFVDITIYSEKWEI